MKKMFILLGLVISIRANALIENERGNGGGAFVCRDINGNILSAELVDMYEARNQLGLELKNFDNYNMDEIFEYIELKAFKASYTVGKNEIYSNNFKDSLDSIRKKIRFVENVTLQETNDFQISIFPKSCEGGEVRFEQLASYTPSDDLIVAKEIYDKLSISNKAALHIHEALYFLARKAYGSESSMEARWATGHFMSTVGGDKIPDSIILMEPVNGAPNARWECRVKIIHNSCFTDSGCSPEYLSEIARYVVRKKTSDEAFYTARTAFHNVTDDGTFVLCNIWTSVDSKEERNNKVLTCTAPITKENSCFKRY